MVERRDLDRVWRELERLDAELRELRAMVAPLDRQRKDVMALLTFGQKLAGFAVVVAAVGGFVLQVAHL